MQKILLWQLVIVLLLSLIGVVFWQMPTGLAILAGGLLVLVPNALFGWMLWRWVDPRYPKRALSALFFGETLKVCLMAAFLVALLHFYAVPLAPLLLGLCGTFLVNFIFGFNAK